MTSSVAGDAPRLILRSQAWSPLAARHTHSQQPLAHGIPVKATYRTARRRVPACALGPRTDIRTKGHVSEAHFRFHLRALQFDMSCTRSGSHCESPNTPTVPLWLMDGPRARHGAGHHPRLGVLHQPQDPPAHQDRALSPASKQRDTCQPPSTASPPHTHEVTSQPASYSH